MVKKTVFCTNCFMEWEPEELCLMFSEGSSQIIAYCPRCNWVEFMSADDYLQLSDNELRQTEYKSDNHETYPIPNETKIIYGGTE